MATARNLLFSWDAVDQQEGVEGSEVPHAAFAICFNRRRV